MDPVEEDPRFAHVASDPRFKPMPKSKKKVKIDSRFQSLFTNKHFSHRMDMDKRGRPALNRSQKNKNTMERFYEMSSDSDDSDDDDDNDDDEESLESDTVSKTNMNEKVKQKNMKKNLDDDVSTSSSPVLSDKNSNITKNLKKKGNKRKQEFTSDDNVSKKKTVKMAEQDENEESCSEDNKELGSDGSEFDEDNDKTDLQADSSDDDDDSEGEDLPMYSTEYDLEETDHQWNELEKDALETSESTQRFAVCNMDWDFVKAQDLFVLFSSFVPKGGSVKSVTIYPSEFGKERMAEEVSMGPKEIREHTLKMEEDKVEKKKRGKKMDEKKEKILKKSSDEVQTEKLREYQLNRLKYYYAVVECDSTRTADMVYTECDGREYQLSSVRLDLRFIPDDMTFDDEPREVFSEKQTVVDYQPSSFESTALCNAKVEVTWDETEFDRLSRRVGIMQQKDLENIIEDNKYANIIAPPESDSEEEEGRPEWLVTALAQGSDEDSEEESRVDDSVQTKRGETVSEEDKIKLYRQILIDKEAEEEEEKKKEDNDVDKVMEWTPGLKSDVKKKLKKKEKNSDETAVVNGYLEKRRQKKKKKRNLKKQKMVPEEGEDAFSDDDDLMDVDDSLKLMMQGEEVYEGVNKEKKKKKKKTEVENEEDDKERAELELMLMDDDDTKHFSKPEIVDDNESKSKKKRKSKKAIAKQKKVSQGLEKEKEDYIMDVEDKRFGALFSSHHFHIDPTAPQFKKTKNMLRLVDEQINRKKSGKKGNTEAESNDQSSRGTKSSKSVSQSLVESLKKKMKKT